MSADAFKRAAAEAALAFVQDGMSLGLGTGSTAAHFVKALGARVRDGLSVRAVPTSVATEKLARAEGIPLVTLAEAPALDLGVDGADEVDPNLNLIKGAGGALLREKIVASACARFIVIADDTKRVAALGQFPLPVEVTAFAIPFAAPRIADAMRRAGCAGAEVTVRGGAQAPYVTDGGNAILDAHCQTIPDAPALAAALRAIPGVVEHGLFLDMTACALIAGPDGVSRIER
ncbi:MAG: ribose-5-phosphate isomerase RpiA [Alphaproteobacteria bacterium]|nr:ribose-5-phosphate isomerase RpiA [Alphaproteobacteria bacterium]